MHISDWSADVFSSDLALPRHFPTIVRRNIAAAHEMNDLQFIAVFDPNIRQCGPWHNLQISLNRHLFGHKAKLACKLRQRQPLPHAAVLAVDSDRKDRKSTRLNSSH